MGVRPARPQVPRRRRRSGRRHFRLTRHESKYSKANDMSLTATLSKWISALRYEHLPEAAPPWVRAAFLDYFAVALAGCKAEGLALLRTYVAAQYAAGDATIIGEKARMG